MTNGSVEENRKRRLNVLEVIEFAAEIWNRIGGIFIRIFCLTFQQKCCDLADIINNLGVSVSVQDYVTIEDHKQIDEEQYNIIEAEADPAEV